MSKPQEFTDANFQNEVLESDLPVLVDFWAAWCGPCRAVGPTIDELAEQYEGTVKVGKLNIDENPQSPSRFGISSIPAVLLFKDGKVVETLVGVQPKERYEVALHQVAA
ncbi:MAG: thioredoxin [Planctomycetes bacterium]|nr:thioredoxin [Planctomycetota bacterium]MCH8217579.1 thioredoxin [Planctomycetota bacterium]